MMSPGDMIVPLPVDPEEGIAHWWTDPDLQKGKIYPCRDRNVCLVLAKVNNPLKLPYFYDPGKLRNLISREQYPIWRGVWLVLLFSDGCIGWINSDMFPRFEVCRHG